MSCFLQDYTWSISIPSFTCISPVAYLGQGLGTVVLGDSVTADLLNLSGESPFGAVLHFRTFGLPSMCSTDSEVKVLLDFKVSMPRSDNQCRAGHLLLGECLKGNPMYFKQPQLNGLLKELGLLLVSVFSNNVQGRAGSFRTGGLCLCSFCSSLHRKTFTFCPYPSDEIPMLSVR